MTAHRTRGIAHLHALAPAAFAAAMFATLVPIRAQDPPAALLEGLLGSKNPGIRGEAAILLGAVVPEKAEATVRAVATDRDPRARALGLLALGWLAPAGAEVTLGRAFDGADDGDLVRIAAGYAMGSLPDAQPVPELDRYVAVVQGGSYRRNHDALAAILAALGNTPHPSRRTALQRLLDDAANRSGALRALAVRALDAAGDEPSSDELERRFDSTFGEVRLATLTAIGNHAQAVADNASRIEKLAATDEDERVRRAALALLVASRHESALGLADQAVRAREPATAAAGIAAATAFADAETRATLAATIASERQGGRASAMLAAWRGPLPARLADVALAIAADRSAPAPDRAIALQVLAREGDVRAIPLLRGLLDVAEDGDTLAHVVDGLAVLGADDDLVERLQPGDTASLRRLAARIEALFRLGRPEAMTLLRTALDDDRIGDVARAELLRAWRRSVVAPPPADVLDALPKELAELLR